MRWNLEGFKEAAKTMEQIGTVDTVLGKTPVYMDLANGDPLTVGGIHTGYNAEPDEIKKKLDSEPNYVKLTVIDISDLVK